MYMLQIQIICKFSDSKYNYVHFATCGGGIIQEFHSVVEAENACSQDTECSVIVSGGLLGNGRLLTCRGPATIEDGYSAWIKGKYIAFSKQIFMFNIAASNFEIIFGI